MVYQSPQKKLKAVGVILDATRPYKTSKSTDYITQIKIIDPSLNYETQISSEKKYLHIFIYSKSLKEAPYITQIGQIIYLKRYDFERKEEYQEVSGKHNHVAKASYCLFDLNEKQENPFEIVSSDNQFAVDVSEKLKEKIKNLRGWAQSFFAKESLFKIGWFGELIINQEEQDKLVDFDMLLKIQEKNKIPDSQIISYALVDAKGQKFYAQFPDYKFQVGNLVKLRSVKKIEPNKKIVLSLYTSMLKISDFFYDIKNFNAWAYQIKFHENQFNIYQSNYSIEEAAKQKPLITVTGSSHSSLKEITTLKQLIQLEENFQKNKNLSLAPAYQIQASIINITPGKVENSVQLFCQLCKKTYDLESKQEQCCSKQLTKIWQMVFALQDSSIENERDYYPIYLYTFDGNPKDIFPSLNLIDISNKEQFQLCLDTALEEIFFHSSSLEPLNFIVQPLKSKSSLLFRIIDTKFIKNF
eukprot:TRINITY_DN3776_c0_g1_i7.p1 TRINITY_DN3776_c0_g1~~TRINITY_DN3776_c0_g1_i7.p1  ORF type:complete len:470 (+),score=73.74 TRINITY_DN3776_c0_g1_i7:119-1528(+)